MNIIRTIIAFFFMYMLIELSISETEVYDCHHGDEQMVIINHINIKSFLQLGLDDIEGENCIIYQNGNVEGYANLFTCHKVLIERLTTVMVDDAGHDESDAEDKAKTKLNPQQICRLIGQ